MAEDVRVEPIAEAKFEQLLPLIAAYQGFYEAEEIGKERNRAFFRRFLAPSDDGMLLGAWRGDELVGYACLYWHFSSTRAVETVLMNDLYVDAAARGEGVGRALIEASAEVARERGAPHLEWSTAPTTTPPSASTTRPAPSSRPGSSTSCRSERRDLRLPPIRQEMHDSPRFEPRLPDDPAVRMLYADFIREADGPLGIDLEAEIAAGPPGT